MAENTSGLTPLPGAENTRLADTRWPGHMAMWNPIDATHGGFAFLASGLKRLLYIPLATASLAGAMGAADKALVNQLGTDGGWASPAFAANWSNFGGTDSTCQYKKDALGWVCLVGMAKKSVAVANPDTIFTLPVGFRPAKDKQFPGVSNGAFFWLKIDTGGNVIVQGGGNAAWVNLTGVRFDPSV